MNVRLKNQITQDKKKTQDKSPEAKPSLRYFVCKESRAGQALLLEELVVEHLANRIYRLFGVHVPPIYILHKKNADKTLSLSIASQQLEGYRDLIDYLGEETHVLDSINTNNSEQDRQACLQALLDNKQIGFKGKNKLLVAAAILHDFDVVGVNFRNIGLNCDQDDHQSCGLHEIINIDTGDISLTDDSESFDSMYDFDKPCLYSGFEMAIFNNPKSLSGNLHLKDFFSGINKPALCNAAVEVIQTASVALESIVKREAYIKVLGEDKLNAIYDVLTARLKAMRAALPQQYQQQAALNRPCSTVSALILGSPIFRRREDFSQPLKRIEYGNAKPYVVREEYTHSQQGPVQATLGN